MRNACVARLLSAFLLMCMLCALLSPGLPADGRLFRATAPAPLRVPTLTRMPSQPAIPAKPERIDNRAETLQRLTRLSLRATATAPLTLPLARRDANGRVVTRCRYVRSVYQVFHADMVGG